MKRRKRVAPAALSMCQGRKGLRGGRVLDVQTAFRSRLGQLDIKANHSMQLAGVNLNAAGPVLGRVYRGMALPGDWLQPSVDRTMCVSLQAHPYALNIRDLIVMAIELPHIFATAFQSGDSDAAT